MHQTKNEHAPASIYIYLYIKKEHTKTKEQPFLRLIVRVAIGILLRLEV